MTLTREQIAGLRELLAKADHLSVAGMGQMVHVEREQFRALLDIAEAVHEAKFGFDDLTEHDLIENGGSCTQEWIDGWNARNEFARLAVLPLAGEVGK